MSAQHAAKRRPSSARSLHDAEPAERIRRIHEANHGVYGARKVRHNCGGATVSQWPAAP